MIDADGAQRAREWLERQLAELGQLRNATRRDQNFKNWRQQTLTVIQRIWPGDTRRGDRFRRIPFTPPSAHANDRQVREYYERGWGEAGILLRELLAEINLLGLSQMQPGGYGDAEGAAPPEHAPMLELPDEPSPPDATESARNDRDDIGRAMERLLGHAPLFRMPPLPAPADESAAEPLPAVLAPPMAEAPEPAFPAADLVQLAEGLDGLDLAPERAVEVRRSLLALARAAGTGPPPWELVSDALAHAGASPALARRALPLLLELVSRAA
jgi:hypothetical protein